MKIIYLTPNNWTTGFFHDVDGRSCALGHLMLETGHRTFAELSTFVASKGLSFQIQAGLFGRITSLNDAENLSIQERFKQINALCAPLGFQFNVDALKGMADPREWSRWHNKTFAYFVMFGTQVMKSSEIASNVALTPLTAPQVTQETPQEELVLA